MGAERRPRAAGSPAVYKVSDLSVRVLSTEDVGGAIGANFADWGVTVHRSLVTVGGMRYSVLVGHEPCGEAPGDDLRWHVSVAGESKPPQWNHLVAVVHHMRPGVVFAVPLPPLSWWLNEHPHCLHVWEVKDDNLVKCWKIDGRGDKPT